MLSVSSRLISLTSLFIIPLGFGVGFTIGKLDYNAIVQATKDAYLNRYLVMSDATRQHITYYVWANNSQQLSESATATPGVVSFDNSGNENLFSVKIEFSSRKRVVETLKLLPEVTTVFTVPLMCH